MLNTLLISLCWGMNEPAETSSTRLFAPVSSDLRRRAVADIDVDQEMPLSNTNLTGNPLHNGRAKCQANLFHFFKKLCFWERNAQLG